MSYAPGAPQTATELHAAYVRVLARTGQTAAEVIGEPWPEHCPGHLDHLYVLAFDDGMVKIGRSGRPAKRLKEFRHIAARFGRRVTHGWLSRPTGDGQQAESCAKRAISRAGAIVRAGEEYFDGIDFAAAVSLAAHAIDEAEAHR